MSCVNLIIKNETYTNHNAIRHTLHYIFRLENPYKFYYGIWPPTEENAILQFEATRKIFSKNTISKKVQHFYITFPKQLQNIDLLNHLSNDIALLFAHKYQVCFALHDDTEQLHTHFIVSTTSYLSYQPPLSEDILKQYIPEIAFLANKYNLYLQKVGK